MCHRNRCRCAMPLVDLELSPLRWFIITRCSALGSRAALSVWPPSLLGLGYKADLVGWAKEEPHGQYHDRDTGRDLGGARQTAASRHSSSRSQHVRHADDARFLRARPRHAARSWSAHALAPARRAAGAWRWNPTLQEYSPLLPRHGRRQPASVFRISERRCKGGPGYARRDAACRLRVRSAPLSRNARTAKG